MASRTSGRLHLGEPFGETCTSELGVRGGAVNAAAKVTVGKRLQDVGSRRARAAPDGRDDIHDFG